MKKEDVDVALELSDLLDLNEITCLTLVLDTYRSQTSLSSNTKRLFKAVYLYQEAKDALLNVLSILLTARSGRTYIREDLQRQVPQPC